MYCIWQNFLITRFKFCEFRVSKNLYTNEIIYMIHALFFTDSRNFNPSKILPYTVKGKREMSKEEVQNKRKKEKEEVNKVTVNKYNY